MLTKKDDRGGRGGRDRDDRGGRREPNRGQRRDDSSGNAAPSDAVAVSFEEEFDNEFNGN